MKTATHNGMTFTGFQKKSTHAIVCIRPLADLEAEAALSEWHAERLVELKADGRVVGNEVHLHFACASSLQLAEKRRAEKAKFGHVTYIVELN